MDLRNLIRVQERVCGATERSADVESDDKLPGGATISCAGHWGTARLLWVARRTKTICTFLGSRHTFLPSREKTPHFLLGKRPVKAVHECMGSPRACGPPRCQIKSDAPRRATLCSGFSPPSTFPTSPPRLATASCNCPSNSYRYPKNPSRTRRGEPLDLKKPRSYGER